MILDERPQIKLPPLSAPEESPDVTLAIIVEGASDKW
jgi:hypothetical protein